MQTLGLTTTPIAATDAGADSAAQTGAVAPSPTGEIFDILMAGTATPTANLMVNTAAADPSVVAPPHDQTAAFAADMEHMVQALAITADVVANGMAARTTHVREIILTVETPAIAAETANTLPALNAVIPSEIQGPALKITDADPATHVDPALVLMLPLQEKAPATPDIQIIVPIHETSESDHSTDIVTGMPLAAVDLVAPLEIPAAQAFSENPVEPHGPWRAEIHGPVLDADARVMATPVYALVTHAPETSLQGEIQTIPAPDFAHDPNATTQIAADVQMPHSETDKETKTDPVRVLTIHVAAGKKTHAAVDAADDASVALNSDDASHVTTEHEHIDDVNVAGALPVTSDQQNFPQQTMLIVVADRQLDQPHQAGQAVADASTDVLEAPHRVWQQMPATSGQTPHAAPAMPTPSLSASGISASSMSASALTGQGQMLTGQMLTGQAQDAEQADAPVVVRMGENTGSALGKLPLRPLLRGKIETKSETNIAPHVANTSSRSSANIRDLVKLGVRDIEVLHGTGSDQASNVSPQVQMVQSDGTATAVRAQLAETSSPEGNAPGSAERRAQAHEIRMRAIERQVVAAVRDGADTIRMQLYPPGLGQIVIRLTMDGSKLKLSTRASSGDAAESLRAIEGDLRDALSTGGLELAGFDVSEDGERAEQRHARNEETETNKNNSRSAKSENFALDMNA